MGKEELISCFQDTLDYSETRLKDKVELSRSSNTVFKEGFVSTKPRGNSECYITVVENTTFATAKRYIGNGKVAVLNFANPENPGGGVKNGAMAQEECLCRSSILYPCLIDDNVFTEYYQYHKELKNTFFSDRLIYTKDVTVFKDDNTIPQMMPEDEWFNVDVITCAAPYLGQRKYTNLTALKKLFMARIKNIFEAAIENEVDVIILGAFGCGAFKNPPLIVAQAFEKVIKENNYQKAFKHIVFAIKATGEFCPNLSAFSTQFDCYAEDAGERCVLLSAPEDWYFGKIPEISYLPDLKDKKVYTERREKGHYFGKQFSVLGDSISTLEGYNPRGYNLFYTGENCQRTLVREYKDTWWGKVIDFFGGELLVNNSWSGSRVTKLPGSEKLFPAGCSDERTSLLHINDTMPDVIIVYLGTNDWARGVNVKSNPRHEKPLTEYFDAAYSMMLGKLRENYPNAEIWCCTLNSTFMSGKPSFVFPKSPAGKPIDEFNWTIRNVAAANKCKVIDFDKFCWAYNSVDGSHPMSAGMDTLAMMVIREMGDESVHQIIDCPNNTHNFEVVEEYTGGTRYVCKKCGKEKHTSMLTLPEDIRDNKMDALIEEIYSKMDPEMREKIFYGGIESAKTILTTICHKAYGELQENNIKNSQEVYVQVWVRSKGGFQPKFSTPSYIREALHKRFSYLPINIIDSLVDASLETVYSYEPDLKEKVTQIEFLKNMVQNNAKINAEIEDRYINDDSFGLSSEKPVFVCGFDGAKIYLSQLETKAGSPIVYNRLGSSEVNGIAGPVDLYEIVAPQEDSKFLIYICNYGTKNPTIAPQGLRFKGISENCIDDSDYVLAEPNKTVLLYNGSLQLTVESTGETHSFEKNNITIGRDPSSDLMIEKKGISRHHASLLYERGMWLLSDNDSTNGTWLNGNKIIPGKKYQLVADDIIDFAHLERVAFYKTILERNRSNEEEKAVAILEAGIKAFAKSDYKDEVAYKLIASALINAPLYFPVEIDLVAMFGNIDPTTLKKGDVIQNKEDVRMRVLTLTFNEGVEVVPIFTSDDEANKGPSSSRVRYYPIDYMPMLLKMDKPIIINPFSDCKFVLDKKLIEEVLLPIVKKNFEAKDAVSVPNDTQDELIGEIIEGKYEIIKEIGRGGLSHVFLGLDKRLNKSLTVKAYDKTQHSFNKVVYDSVMQETHMLMKLEHPCIPRIFDLIEDEKHLFIVREYIEGRTLDSIVRENGPLGVEQTVDIAKKLCATLHYLHTLTPPHIHRDIKPHNVIIANDGSVKLIDFGIMRLYDPKKSMDTVCLGTKGYAAPEQYGGMGQTDARTDIYALGMTMFNLITGINPNDPPYEIKPIRQINPALPKRLEDIICKCIEPNPDKRYQSAAVLMAVLNGEKDPDAPKGLLGKLFGKK